MPDPEPTRRFRFSLKQLFLAVALVASGLGVWNWVFHKEVVIRAATQVDGVPEIPPSGMVDILNARNAVFATGTFIRDMQVIVMGTIVQNGRESNAVLHEIERINSTIRDPIRESAALRIVVIEWEQPGGRAKGLYIDGLRGRLAWSHAGAATRLTHNISFVAKKTLPGTITPGRPHIVYVEGDQAIVVDAKMTVEEFAKANPGNYLVVTVEVR